MTYLPEVAIYGSDNGTIDAFSRLRMSEPFTVFDSKQIFDSASLFWDTSGSAGGFAQYTQSRASTKLYVPASASAFCGRQTKQHFNYQPGKSQLIILTFGGSPTPAGINKRLGYYNNQDGLFFTFSSSYNYVGWRSSVTGAPIDTQISQSDWNLDKMDGTGPSRQILDPTKSQIAFIDFEWLGVGRAKWGFFNDGHPIYVHERNNANISESVYMSTPNLPLRYTISNASGVNSGYFEQVCGTVISEGGFNQAGLLRTIDIGGFSQSEVPVGRTITTNGYESLLAIRLKSTHLGATVIPTGISIVGSTAAVAKWALLINPGVAGTAYNWVDIPNSALQKSVVDAQTITQENVKILSGYMSSETSVVSKDIETALTLGSNIDGTRDILVLAVYSLSVNETYYGSLTYRELI